MASFYDIHGSYLRDASRYAYRDGDLFRIYALEPVMAPSETDYDDIANAAVKIVTFRRVSSDYFEPAFDEDRDLISEWIERHQNTPASAWDAPSFS